MAVTLRTLLYAVVTGLTHRNQEVGDRSAFQELTVTVEPYQTGMVVADNYQEEVLWAAGDGGLATYSVAIIETDADIVVELQDGAVYSRTLIKAGYGIVGGKLASAMGGDGAAATLGDVDQIMVKRNEADGVGDANVRITLIL
jgi:hypothetical protein